MAALAAVGVRAEAWEVAARSLKAAPGEEEGVGEAMAMEATRGVA